MIQLTGQVMITLNKVHTTIGLLKTYNLALCPQPPVRTFFSLPHKGLIFDCQKLIVVDHVLKEIEKLCARALCDIIYCH